VALREQGNFTILLAILQGRSIQKKITILFFDYFGTHNNKIHTIYKQTSFFCFDFFHVVVLVLLVKQQQKSSIYIRSQYAEQGPCSSDVLDEAIEHKTNELATRNNIKTV
jgi:hypothetical protein